MLQLARNIVALQIEKRGCTYYRPPQTLSRNKICCCKLKKFVEKSRRHFNLLQQVGGNTANNAFQLATQQCCVKVEEKCCPYCRALRKEGRKEESRKEGLKEGRKEGRKEVGRKEVGRKEGLEKGRKEGSNKEQNSGIYLFF